MGVFYYFIYISKFEKVMQIKLDIKSILILFLLGFCILFFSLWFLKGTGYKKEFKQLEKEYKQLKHTRDSLNTLNIKLKSDFNNTQKDIDKRNKIISDIEKELKKTKADLDDANIQIVRNKKDLEEVKGKIDKLKKQPIKREGEELINSLKQKLN